MSNLIQIKELSFTLPDGRGLLLDISLKVDQGQLIWISGPSGGGKTTLLRIINRLISPERGELQFQGRDYGSWPVPLLRRQLALIPQTPVLIPGTVEENLLLPFKLKAADGNSIPTSDHLNGTLDRLGLEGLELGQNVGGLSVGQSQRVSLGRVLLMKPRVMLMDEPLAALDDDSRRLVEEATQSFVASGNAVIMASHIPPAGGHHSHLRLDRGSLSRATSGGQD